MRIEQKLRERFRVNGKEVFLQLTPDETLLHTLRNNGYTEVKNGCEEGECGACLVLINDRAFNSCQVLSMSVKECDVKTVKGVGTLFEPSEIQRAFAETGAVQCGFCIPGFIIATYALLKENKDPTDEEIKKALDGNLCRCTGYKKIIDAVKLAARRIL